ncbi:MAG: hypothetical protein SNJ29_12845 [Rikenellaceae bacterium]
MLRSVDRGFKFTDWWYGWKHTSFENAYMRLDELIERVLMIDGVTIE